MGLIHLAQDRSKWWVLINTALKFCILFSVQSACNPTVFEISNKKQMPLTVVMQKFPTLYRTIRIALQTHWR